jgi:hypothetical protein
LAGYSIEEASDESPSVWCASHEADATGVFHLVNIVGEVCEVHGVIRGLLAEQNDVWYLLDMKLVTHELTERRGHFIELRVRRRCETEDVSELRVYSRVEDCFDGIWGALLAA